MKKYLLDMKVKENIRLHANYCLLKFTSDLTLPEMLPGQFVQVKVNHSPSTFLRRPFSIHFVDRDMNELWLLVQVIGDGTRRMSSLLPGEMVNIMLPLGRGFTLPPEDEKDKKFLLAGGGVGMAPLLYMGYFLKKNGFTPTFLLGTRSRADLVQLREFEKYGEVYITTEDASAGETGYVTDHSILVNERFDHIYACGPKPMMMAVAGYASARSVDCEVSLENTMACGIGACLCCVEKTREAHNVCVCTEGPVFNIKELSWQN